MKMTKLHKKIATAAATGAMFLNLVTPAFAASYTFEVSGNGSHSENDIDLNRESSTEVFQTNQTQIVNQISVSSNTGGNDVSDNTGGDVSLETGDTTVAAEITNQAGINQAEVESCDCETDADIKVSGNGTYSDNKVDVETAHNTSLVQVNTTSIANALAVEANSGDNDVEDNTGGVVDVKTGNVTIAPVEIANLAGVNSAHIGTGHGAGASELNLKIAGNGSHSDNDIDVDQETGTELFQLNATQILNELYLAGNTGENDVNDNTGDVLSDPALTTGDVTIKAYIDNAAGFNVATADCGCVLDVTGSIMENGTDSENDIELELDDAMVVAQDNADMLVNAGEVESQTGKNDVEDNTSGEVNVETGDTTTVVEASNMGGTNLFGEIEFELPFGWSFVFGL